MPANFDDGFSMLVVLLVLAQIALVVVFLVMAANVGRIRKILDDHVSRNRLMRSCPSCMEPMRREAKVCPHCQRESEPWRYEDGRWWTANEAGDSFYLDERKNDWLPAPPDEPRTN